jgi:hypothetical protein
MPLVQARAKGDIEGDIGVTSAGQSGNGLLETLSHDGAGDGIDERRPAAPADGAVVCTASPASRRRPVREFAACKVRKPRARAEYLRPSRDTTN